MFYYFISRNLFKALRFWVSPFLGKTYQHQHKMTHILALLFGIGLFFKVL